MNKKLIIANIIIFLGAALAITMFYYTAPIQAKFSEAEMEDLVTGGKAIVIKPLLTANAYQRGGFYDYYHGICDESCLSIPINETARYDYNSSRRAIEVLGKLGYPMITDVFLESNPSIIFQYDTVILLHSEYVTQKTFNVITHHPNVLYLYPNSLYAEIEIDNGTMRLIRGHQYPDHSITNGFGWIHDNHDDEFDNKCETTEWRKITNGYQLKCYPENRFYYSKDILSFIRAHS